LEVISLNEDDLYKMLKANIHLCDQICGFQMESYVYKRNPSGLHIINLQKTWEKILFAARAIVAIDNPADVCIIGSTNNSQRGLLKFASHTGAASIAGRFTPGTFTNQITSQFKEPRLIIICDTHTDRQALIESSYSNIPTIALCNTSSYVKFVDIVIPCNTKSTLSVGLILWLLAREVLRFRGIIPRDIDWDVMPDLYFYRSPTEIEREEVGKEINQEASAGFVPPPVLTAADTSQLGEDDWARIDSPSDVFAPEPASKLAESWGQ
jgi:small subunit ribosomal protein SAe